MVKKSTSKLLLLVVSGGSVFSAIQISKKTKIQTPTVAPTPKQIHEQFVDNKNLTDVMKTFLSSWAGGQLFINSYVHDWLSQRTESNLPAEDNKKQLISSISLKKYITSGEFKCNEQKTSIEKETCELHKFILATWVKKTKPKIIHKVSWNYVHDMNEFATKYVSLIGADSGLKETNFWFPALKKDLKSKITWSSIDITSTEDVGGQFKKEIVTMYDLGPSPHSPQFKSALLQLEEHKTKCVKNSNTCANNCKTFTDITGKDPLEVLTPDAPKPTNPLTKDSLPNINDVMILTDSCSSSPTKSFALYRDVLGVHLFKTTESTNLDTELKIILEKESNWKHLVNELEKFFTDYFDYLILNFLHPTKTTPPASDQTTSVTINNITKSTSFIAYFDAWKAIYDKKFDTPMVQHKRSIVAEYMRYLQHKPHSATKKSLVLGESGPLPISFGDVTLTSTNKSNVEALYKTLKEKAESIFSSGIEPAKNESNEYSFMLQGTSWAESDLKIMNNFVAKSIDGTLFEFLINEKIIQFIHDSTNTEELPSFFRDMFTNPATTPNKTSANTLFTSITDPENTPPIPPANSYEKWLQQEMMMAFFQENNPSMLTLPITWLWGNENIDPTKPSSSLYEMLKLHDEEKNRYDNFAEYEQNHPYKISLLKRILAIRWLFKDIFVNYKMVLDQYLKDNNWVAVLFSTDQEEKKQKTNIAFEDFAVVENPSHFEKSPIIKTTETSYTWPNDVKPMENYSVGRVMEQKNNVVTLKTLRGYEGLVTETTWKEDEELKKEVFFMLDKTILLNKIRSANSENSLKIIIDSISKYYDINPLLSVENGCSPIDLQAKKKYLLSFINNNNNLCKDEVASVKPKKQHFLVHKGKMLFFQELSVEDISDIKKTAKTLGPNLFFRHLFNLSQRLDLQESAIFDFFDKTNMKFRIGDSRLIKKFLPYHIV